MWFTMTMMEISTNKLFFIEKIAKPAEPVNGQDERRINAPPLTVPPVFADGQSRRESPKMASRPFQFLEKKRSKIRKRAAKHFEGLAALSTHSAGRRAAVKAGCKPVHFSLDSCPLSCYFSGSVATTLGHFVHKSEHRTKDGGFHVRPVCC